MGMSNSTWEEIRRSGESGNYGKPNNVLMREMQ